MIYRIAEPEDWQRAQKLGYFASSDLTVEGFIHCCSDQQIPHVLNRYYPGREDILLLAIDDAALSVPVKWEDLNQIGDVFPHVYGAIPLTAITVVSQSR